MAKVKFIAAEFIKDNSIIDENVDVKYLDNTVIMCQDINLQELIGSDLYAQLKTEVEAYESAATPIPALDKTLLDDYIRPYLLNLVLAEVIIPMTYKFANKSIALKSSENAQPIDRNDLQLLKGDFDSKAQWYGERMRKYLLANNADYPLYLNGNNDLDDVRPRNTAYQTNIFTGNPRRRWPGRNLPGFTDGDHCCD